MKLHAIQFKIFISTVLCVMLVSLAGSLYLYRYINTFIYDKSRHIDHIYLATVSKQIETYLVNYTDLGLQCANDASVVNIMNKKNIPARKSSLAAIQTQEKLTAYASSFMAHSYIDKLAVFSENDIIIQATNSRRVGSPDDWQNLWEYSQELTGSSQQPKPYYLHLKTSVTEKKELVLSLLTPVYNPNHQAILGYVYIEMGLDLLTDLLLPYSEANNLFLTTENGDFLTSRPSILPADMFLPSIRNGIYQLGNQSYEFSCQSFSNVGLLLYSCAPFPFIGSDNGHLLNIILMVLIISFLGGMILAYFASHILSKPIQILHRRLQKITAGDFSFDPQIEESTDEIGQIGHTVNEMTQSFSNLLKNTQKIHAQQRKIEIALLQSQVNPHFLYNTLDSIHWMAVIQKNPGIQQMTRGLCNLLKNLAKGTEDHIPLSEELSILNEYIAIQSIRYLETFEFVNQIPKELEHYRILKFTLQPLVENAIFHGIAPKGTCGTIHANGMIKDNCLCLTITDDGAGIPPTKLSSLLSAPPKNKNKESLNSIGVYNVNQRLKLVYGTQYGLSYESTEGIYTAVTILIPLEE